MLLTCWSTNVGLSSYQKVLKMRHSQVNFSKSGVSLNVSVAKMDSVAGAFAGLGANIGGGYGDEICKGVSTSKADFLAAGVGGGKGIVLGGQIGPGGVGRSLGVRPGVGVGAFVGSGVVKTLTVGITWK
jgi:hypothetical protein